MPSRTQLKIASDRDAFFVASELSPLASVSLGTDNVTRNADSPTAVR